MAVCCSVAKQQQQLDDWCSHQLPAAAATDAEQTGGSTGKEHHAVGLLAGHEHVGSVEVSLFHTHTHCMQGVMFSSVCLFVSLCFTHTHTLHVGGYV